MHAEGKVAVITGSGRGLGRASALALANEGASVALLGPEQEALEAVARELAGIGADHLHAAGDVSVEADVKRLVDKVAKRFGTVDILVNNAAVIGPPRFLEDADSEEWFRTININLNGMYLACRAVLPMMKKQKSGRIINVSSGLGRMPFPRFCAYGVSKAGVDQLTRSLSSEFAGDNIRVNAIDPGVMDTAMQERIRSLAEDKLGPELKNRFVSYKDQGQLDDPADVARLIVYLSSEGAGEITGKILSLADLPAGFSRGRRS